MTITVQSELTIPYMEIFQASSSMKYKSPQTNSKMNHNFRNGIIAIFLFQFSVIALILRHQYVPTDFKIIQDTGHFQDFSGLQKCTPNYLFQPRNISDLINFVQKANEQLQKIKVVGAGHSMSPIAFTDENLVNLDYLDRLIRINKTSKQVTVQAGIRIKKLTELIASYNLALQNVGQITEQSIAGAISTATHGSSSYVHGTQTLEFGSISTQVVNMKIMDSQGNIHFASSTENVDLFNAARCSLGALGIITEVTLQCVDLQSLEIIEEEGPFAPVLENYQKFLSNTSYFRFWYIPYTNYSKIINFHRTEKPKKNSLYNRMGEYFGIPFLLNILSVGKMFNMKSHKLFTEHFFFKRNMIDRPDLVLTAPHPPKYIETEYFFPIESLHDVHREFRDYITNSPVYYNLISEIRFIAKDDIWLSPFYKRDSVAISVILYDSNSIWKEYSKGIELIFMKYGGRPHYGKYHTRNATSLKKEFEKWDDFLRIRKEMDPNGMFLNEYLNKVLFE